MLHFYQTKILFVLYVKIVEMENGHKFVSKMPTGKLPPSPNLGIHMYNNVNTGICLFKECSPCPNDRFKKVNYKKESKNSEGSGTKSLAQKSFEN